MSHATSFSDRAHRAAIHLSRLARGGTLVMLGMAAVLYPHNRRTETNMSSESVVAVAEAPSFAEMALVVMEESKPSQLSREMAQVSDWVSQRYRVSTVMLEPALRAAEESGRRIGVDPLLLVAMMAVESSFNPFAESRVGAQGLMQVIPRFHLDKLSSDMGEDALFDPVINVRVGALVLYEGLNRYGSLQTALQYYGGAMNDPAAAYARKVLAMKQRLATAAGRKSEVASKGEAV
ncbi:MAG: transglycosylase SLT domain-containing protein [Azoarcus sp.]|jgi:soluble lytic murein transglycosylase-like protein|nr:transglycosylase SLT domain-containing protein [Azoarcus sp.]